MLEAHRSKPLNDLFCFEKITTHSFRKYDETGVYAQAGLIDKYVANWGASWKQVEELKWPLETKVGYKYHFWYDLMYEWLPMTITIPRPGVDPTENDVKSKRKLSFDCGHGITIFWTADKVDSKDKVYAWLPDMFVIDVSNSMASAVIEHWMKSDAYKKISIPTFY